MDWTVNLYLPGQCRKGIIGWVFDLLLESDKWLREMKLDYPVGLGLIHRVYGLTLVEVIRRPQPGRYYILPFHKGVYRQ